LPAGRRGSSASEYLNINLTAQAFALKARSFAPGRLLLRVPDEREVTGREGQMVASAITRRAAISALSAFALSLTVAAPGALAQNGMRFSNIRVNVAPLRANTGDPTAAWMEQALARALPQALGGTGPGGSAQDTIVGSFIVRGPRGGIESQIPLRAIASY
jgi:hypothetical protein